MLNDRLAAAFNDQITMEFASSYSYVQLAAYFEAESLTGFSAWMRVQSDEERLHAFKLYDFVLDRGNEVVLGSIEAPDVKPGSALDAFRIALEQERSVTNSLAALYELAQSEGDGASHSLLQWFLTEQVEEESLVGEIVDQLSFADGNPAAILMLDRELAGRSPEDNAAE